MYTVVINFHTCYFMSGITLYLLHSKQALSINKGLFFLVGVKSKSRNTRFGWKIRKKVMKKVRQKIMLPKVNTNKKFNVFYIS